MGNCNKKPQRRKSEEKYRFTQSENIKKVGSPLEQLSLQKKPYSEDTTSAFEDIRKHYIFEDKVIGVGHYGSVRLARKQDSINPNVKFAVKTINKKKIRQNLHFLRTELEILKHLDHPNIVKFIETYQDPIFFHIVMEHLSGGELFEKIIKKGSFTEYETQTLKYMHQHGIVHRDLKPENFLFSNNQENAEIKIIDFGLSQIIRNEDVYQGDVVGTALYLAPEAITGTYTAKVDMWAVGIITYILLSGEPPFKSQQNSELFDSTVKNGKRSQVQLKILFQNYWRGIIRKDILQHNVQRTNGLRFLQIKLYGDNSKIITYLIFLLQMKFSKEEDNKIDPNIVNMMKNFRSEGRFKKEVMRVLINWMDEEDHTHLRKIFRTMDKGKTGYICIHELKDAMSLCDHPHSEEEIQNIMKTFTLDSESKYINYTDFLSKLMDKKKYLTEENLYQVFKHFDTDKTGNITAKNLKEVMIRCGRKLDDKQIDEIIKESDLTDDNKISWIEFLHIMSNDNDIDDLKSQMSKQDSQRFLQRNDSIASYSQMGMEIGKMQPSRNDSYFSQAKPQNQQQSSQEENDVIEVIGFQYNNQNQPQAVPNHASPNKDQKKITNQQVIILNVGQDQQSQLFKQSMLSQSDGQQLEHVEFEESKRKSIGIRKLSVEEENIKKQIEKLKNESARKEIKNNESYDDFLFEINEENNNYQNIKETKNIRSLQN